METCGVTKLECAMCQPCCEHRIKDNKNIEQQFMDLVRKNPIVFNCYQLQKMCGMVETDSLKSTVVYLCEYIEELEKQRNKLLAYAPICNVLYPEEDK
jgi:hypothetical protein